MGTIKKVWKYFLLLILIYIIVTILTNTAMRDNFIDITNYEIKCESPEIVVSECKASRTQGYIKGNVTNNTGKHIPIKYLRVDLYDKDSVYLGTECKELKYFNVNETIEFDINFKYDKVDKVLISIVDKVEEKQKTDIISSAFKDTNDDVLKIGLSIASVLFLYTVLP